VPIVEQSQSAPEARLSPTDLVLGDRLLNPMQRGAMRYLPHLARNLVVAAPTGSGKTLLAELALAATVADGGLGIYLAPMKAIASEKRADWQRLAAAGLRIYKSTGDDDAFDPERARAASVILATPEKLDGILRRGLAVDLAQRLRLVVVDEVHMIGDEGRGAGLEALLTRLRLRLPGARLLAMSATIPNAADIATWLDADLYRSDWRPVPLVSTIHPYIASGDRQADQEERTRIAAQLAGETVREGGAVLVFCGSRQGVETCAVALARRLALPAVRLEAGQDPGSVGEERDPRSPGDGAPRAATLGGGLPGVRVPLQRALAGGVGYHHAGLSPRERLGVEELFRSGAIRVLVATSTVAAGVNLPAREVIVRDLTLGMEPIGASALLQMAGRAGRPGLELEGRCRVIAPTTEVARVTALLAGQPVRSRLAADLGTFINAEIAAGGVRSCAELDTWYAHTLHGRLSPAPLRLPREVEWLRCRGFIDVAEDRFEPTSLGHTTSSQMLGVSTAAALDRYLERHATWICDADALEESLLIACCGLSAEGTDETLRPDGSILAPAVREYDAELAGWEPGRLMALGIAACLLGGTSLERFKLEDQWAVRHRVQTDVARLLRFLARRALDRRPAVPHIAIAAADLAAALEYEVLDRGVSALLEAIRRHYPADEARRRRVGARYAALRADAVRGGSGQAAFDGVSGDESRFLDARPPLTGRVRRTGMVVAVDVGPLAVGSTLHARLRAPGQSSDWSGPLPSGGIFVVAGQAGSPPPWCEIELAAVARHPLLWRYARISVPGTRAAEEEHSPRRGLWQAMERYEAVAPRLLPLANHLARWVPRIVRCPACGAAMRERSGARGTFMGCSRYPDCTGTQPAH